MNDHRSELAVACSLGPAGLSDRRIVWEQLGERALRQARPTAGGVQLVYAASEETERELRELARLEGDCCSFAEWRVSRQGDELLLDVISAGDGAAAIRTLFGLPL